MENNLNRIAELKAKTKLSPNERGELASLERLEKKKNVVTNRPSGKVVSNTFGTVATTKIVPKPIRFLESELTALSTRIDTLKTNCSEDIINELGSMREMNSTKLIRAALVLLMEADDKTVIRAIKDVQMKMFRRN
ncbi:hypothetical protein [Shewanella frigidimarina]|uniref:hypothetical protein n=1 Tax=Shewanella frigidimarina TaxID=56812 RepID=UPI003D7BB21C